MESLRLQIFAAELLLISLVGECHWGLFVALESLLAIKGPADLASLVKFHL